ncbi:glycosyltransferase [Pontibacter sp. 13R65]|uniref:glycosyltransferase n=1 Tax=Pontibacter sp. 13R65 TaxID=3127458 RepID=UPI00301D86A7
MKNQLGKNVLFICYWSWHDGLTRSAAMPHVRVLDENQRINKILLVTIEREHNVDFPIIKKDIGKIAHIPLYPDNFKFNLLTKINDFIRFPKKLVKLVKQYQVDILIAHGAPAGALAYKIWKQTQIPFYVSSFEPHAAYMLESGVWSKSGLKYKFQKHWEQQQKRLAAGLLPVSDHYRQVLEKEGVPPEKLKTVACTTSLHQFNFQLSHRQFIRERLQWQQEVIGIYVGKYGGLYYEQEAFEIYKTCFEQISSFRLLILSPQKQADIEDSLLQHQLDLKMVKVLSVPHEEVPQYLSAADFAFATYKPGPSKQFLSPVKIGEYWATGLPVLLTEGIGDDSDIIEREGGGALFNLGEAGSVEKAIQKIQDIIKQPRHREQIRELAVKYRSQDQIRKAYEYFLGEPEDGE